MEQATIKFYKSHDNIKQRNLILVTSLVSIVEYYDFTICALFASYLNIVFEISTNRELSYFFLIFAVGYIARPLGGVTFGILGDKFYSRKKIFLLSAILMSLSTLLIAFIPVNHNYSLLMLSFLRFLQGFALGAELPGAVILVFENVDSKKKGAYIGLIISGAVLGSILANFISYIIIEHFSINEIHEYAWRIPFFIGGCLVILSLFLRTKLFYFLEDNLIKKAQPFKNPISYLLKRYLFKILISTSLTLLISTIIVTILYLPAYLNTYFAYTMQEIYLSMLTGKIFFAIISPIIGSFITKKNNKQIISYSIILFIFFISISYILIVLYKTIYLYPFFCIYQALASSLLIGYFYFIVAAFPSHIRFTGIAFSFNIAYIIASFFPSLVSHIIKLKNDASLLFILYILVALISYLSFKILTYKDKTL